MTDWRSVEVDEDEVPSKRKKTNNAETFYQKLKESIKQEGTSNQVEEMNITLTNDPIQDRKLLLKKIENIDKMINVHRLNGIKHRCNLGEELAKLKTSYYCKCYSHDIADTDAFVLLHCILCSNGSKNNLKPFFNTVKESIGYSKGHINFLISMAELAKKYPKFKLTSMPTNEIKSNMNYLKERILLEQAFWQ